MAISIEIGGVSKTSITKRDNFNISWKLGAQAVGRVRIFDASSGSYRPVSGKEFTIFDGATPIWCGSIDEHVDLWQGSTVLYYDLTLVGHELRLAKLIVNALAYGREPFESNAISDVLTLENSGHGLQNGYPVGVRSSGTLPAPLSDATKYYVVNRTSSTVQLSTSVGGSPVNLTDDGSGNHYLVWYTGAIFHNLNTVNALAEGLTLGTIRDGVPFEPGSPFIWQNVAEINGALAGLGGMVWFVAPDKSVSMVSRDEFAAPFDITDSSSEVLFSGLQFRHTREEKGNAVYVRINKDAFAPTVANLTGDGVKRIFRVATVIESIVSLSVNSAVQEVGVYGVDTSKDWYYTPGDHWLYQDPGGTVLTSGDSASVLYRAEGQDYRFAEDTADQTAVAAIETGTTGIYQVLKSNDGILSLEAGDSAAEAALAEVLNSPVEMRYRTRTSGILPGQVQHVALTIHDINADFLIDSVDAELDPDGEPRYSIRALSTTRLGDALTLFRSFIGGGGGGGVSGAAVGGGTAPGSIQIAY